MNFTRQAVIAFFSGYFTVVHTQLYLSDLSHFFRMLGALSRNERENFVNLWEVIVLQQ